MNPLIPAMLIAGILSTACTPDRQTPTPGIQIMNTNNTAIPEVEQVDKARYDVDAAMDASTAHKPITRYMYGEPRHYYPLLHDIDISPSPGIAGINFIHQSDGTLNIELPLRPGEAIWGGGQRLDAFNLVGRSIEVWTVDGWNALHTSYYAIPFLISSEGYGLFVNSTGLIRADIGESSPDRMTLHIPEAGADVYLFRGTPAEIAMSYTSLVGRPRRPPDWIYKPWASRNSYLGAYEIDRVVRRMRDLGMPLGVVVLEAWAESLHNFKFETRRYPDPELWIRQLHNQDVRVICWLTSSVWPGSLAHRQASERGFLVLNDDGSEHVVRWLENGRKIDFRKPEVRDWWRDLHLPLVNMGVDGFKTDGGEHMPDPFFHNQHTYYYQKAALDAFDLAGREGITFARSANPLNAGLSTYWAGDQMAEWSRLRGVVRAGLSASLAGFVFWGHDVGGYSGTPTKELYLRWLQLGVFSPILQLHGEGAREPWHFDQETLNISRFYFDVRERLLPQLITWGHHAVETGVPMLRPVVWDYPDDPRVNNLDDQYLFGPDLLIAPILDPLPLRGVYLPEGEWIDLWSGKKHTGPDTILHHANLAMFPVFARSGSESSYQNLFSEAPDLTPPPVEIALAGPKTDRGVPPVLRYWRANNDPERIVYEVRNHTSNDQVVQVQLRLPPGFSVEPAPNFSVTLAPGERQRLVWSARPPPNTPPGTHPIQILGQIGERVIRGPTVAMVISPSMKAIGLFEGGVGSIQALDGQPVNFSATYHDRNNRSLSWVDIPDSAIAEDGRIDLGQILGGDGGSTSYVHIRIPSDRARSARFLIGTGDAMTLWVNGVQIADIQAHRNVERDEDNIPARLVAGVNHVVIRISRDLGGHSLYFRMID